MLNYNGPFEEYSGVFFDESYYFLPYHWPVTSTDKLTANLGFGPHLTDEQN